jgi:hypothetical protein
MLTIHMNGRIYDPVLARFLSADIVVQMPGAITSYNRYAYVMNNPLAYTDPSGYFIEEIIVAIIAFAQSSPLLFAASVASTASTIAFATGHNTAGRRFLAAAIMFATAGTPYAVMGAFAAGGVQSGSIEGAIMAGLGAGLFAAAGGIADAAMFNEMAEFATSGAMGPTVPSAFSVGGIGRAGMHFGAGAVRAMMSGGDPVRGGFSAGFAEIAGPYVSGTAVGIKQFAVHVAAGGIGEVIAGGKFANGAVTGAFAWLYNHLSRTQIKDLYGSRDGGGHHKFTRDLAQRYAQYLSDDAIEFASGTKIGAGYTSRGLEGDPHNGYPKAHRQADAKMEEMLKADIANGLYSKESPMTKYQMAKFLERASSEAVIQQYWSLIDQFVMKQIQSQKPNLNQLLRGVGNGGGRGASEQ